MKVAALHNQSFLAPAEQELARAIIARLPEDLRPLHLTRIGLAGAALAAVALIGCRWSAVWLGLVAIGVFLNWFGNSLDGPLSRHRGEERPHLGLIDHANDLFSYLLMIVAFGLSPFLSLKSAIVVMICFLLFSTYTYIRAAAHHVRQMAYIGVGATEFRILLIVWAFTAHALGVDETVGDGVSRIDAAIMLLAVLAVCGLMIKIASDARQIASEEKSQSDGSTPHSA